MHLLSPYFKFHTKKAQASLLRCLCSHSSTFDSRTCPYVLFLEEATWSPEMCCFCWTAFRRHKQKSGCVFVFPMIWQLFMPSCWAVASGCPVSYGRACYDRGKQKQLLFQVMLSSGRKFTLLQVLLLCMGVTFLPQHQGGPMTRNRFFLFVLWRVLPCLITLSLFSHDYRAAWKYPESCSETLWCQSHSVPCQSFLCHVPTHSSTSTNATWSAITMNVNPSSQVMGETVCGVSLWLLSGLSPGTW